MIDDGWKFDRREIGGGGQSVAFDDSQWDNVTLPHTWNAKDGQDGGNNYYRGGAWYRRKLTIDPKDIGKSFFLRFEGAATVADVYVNGTHVGQHRGNFGAFCFEITDYVHAGEDNVVAVRADNSKFDDVPPISGDFTISGGLYRDVHLLTLSPLSVSPTDDASPGVYLTPMGMDGASATVAANVKLRNGHIGTVVAQVICTIIDAKGTPVAVAQTSRRMEARTSTDAGLKLTIPRPHFWNGLRDPYMYRAIVQVKQGEFVVDEVTQPLGLRTFDVDPNHGFFLNGKHYALHGVNRHQDRIDKGWAISKKDLEEDYDFIRELGATAVRLAHYEHSEDEYSLCDQKGLVVWAELAYVNETGAMPGFGENAKQQLRELIKQNYNHPSICFWSLFNELSFGKAQKEEKPEQVQLVRELNALAKELDPTRATVAATHLAPEHPVNWISDLTAFNKYYGWYGGTVADWPIILDDWHMHFPDKRIGLSEYGAGASINQHEYRTVRPDTRSQWHPEEWQCTVHEAVWKAVKDREWIWGTFAWCMFDFASDGRSEGDHMGRNDKGLVTYDRKTRKDAFYFYKANWSNEATVHITASRMNPRPAGLMQVKVYSNCDQLELFLDGATIGVGTGKDGIYLWDANLSPGKHKFVAVGLKDGKTYKDQVVWEIK